VYDFALFFHLTGVLLFVAGIVLAGVGFELARRQQTPAEVALLLSLTRVGVLLVGSGSLLIGIFGLWLVHLGGFGYGAGWVDASIVLFALALVLGAAGGQRPKQARRLANRLRAANVPVTEELHSLLNDRLSQAANYGSLFAVVAVLVLMVFKP
jgi:uncharacterized membrane protein